MNTNTAFWGAHKSEKNLLLIEISRKQQNLEKMLRKPRKISRKVSENVMKITENVSLNWRKILGESTFCETIIFLIFSQFL